MRTKAILALCLFLLALAQVTGQKRSKLVTVSGSVTDTLMAPVYGALIIVDGESTGVQTRKNGTYKLRIRPGTRSIGAYTVNMGSVVAMYEGLNVIDLVLDGRNMMPGFTPVLPDGEKEIDVGYATVKKKDLTSDVGYINGQADGNSVYTNIYDMIQGKVPGVQVTGNKIIIRGINTLTLSTDPLFLVDGMVVESIDNINPRQVKSISVLKGADAAIYGSRSAGGVILITLIGGER